MFTIGTDAEVFLKDVKGEFVASCGLFGGSKEDPVQFPGADYGQMYQEDNVALEFNIPACRKRTEFVYLVQDTLLRVNKLAEQHNLHVAKDAVAFFKPSALSHPNALVFGCEPDYNAWKMIKNKRPQLPKCRANMRTAAAHIHIGTKANIIDVAKRLDVTLGIQSVLMTEKNMRRSLYGRAGDIRPKPYGLEYRTLDNFWIFSTELISWVYNGVSEALTPCSVMDSLIEEHKKAIQRCINKHDKDEALRLLNIFGRQI